MREKRRTPWNPGRAGTLLAAVAVVGACVWAIRDFARWKSLGPGGLPANVRGWLTMTRFRWMAHDELDVRELAAPVAAGHPGPRFWTNIRLRSGLRPAVSPYPIPHRQLDQLPEAAVRQQLRALFDAAVRSHADELGYVLSYFEKRHPAITLANCEGLMGASSHGEVAHIHPSDSSMHMILSPCDAVAAIENGWAQRHGLAGLAAGLPPTYVMIYAPRHGDDCAAIADLLQAAIAYASMPSPASRALQPSSV